MKKKKVLGRFRMVGIAEGFSFLLLLLVAMPLKYFFNVPEAVLAFGWIHGALFISFIYLAFEVMTAFGKPLGWLGKAFAAAFIPFGTFVFDKQLKKEDEALSEEE